MMARAFGRKVMNLKLPANVRGRCLLIVHEMEHPMITNTIHRLFGYAVLGLALAGFGCASDGKNGSSASADASGAMMCPKCETVWVSTMTDQGLKTQRLSSEKKMTCPDCNVMATAYLEGDKKVLHDCPTCKVAPTIVAPAPSYPKGSHHNM